MTDTLSPRIRRPHRAPASPTGGPGMDDLGQPTSTGDLRRQPADSPASAAWRALLAEGGPILADGAMGTMLFSAGLQFGDPPEVWSETQPEVDHYWDKLAAGGQQVQCGWLKDKYGLSWQVVPNALIELVQDKDPAKSQRVMAAMMQMKKIDIAGLKAAYAA